MSVIITKLNEFKFERNCRGNLVNSFLEGLLHEKSQFGSSFLKILPGEKTSAHEHHERENFIVLNGSGYLVADEIKYDLEKGMSIYVPSFVRHEICNTSNDQDLILLTIYWNPGLSKEPYKYANTQIALVSAYPTPNGPLHLGHLSGPFLAFDIYHRFFMDNGFGLNTFIGFDSQQGHVVNGAKNSSKPLAEFLSENIHQIKKDFKLSNILHDCWLDTADEIYCQNVRKSVELAISKGIFVRRSFKELFCQSCRRFCTGTEFIAECPICDSGLSTNECENCFNYIANSELVNPKCAHCSDLLKIKVNDKIVFPLSEHQNLLKEIKTDSKFISDYHRSLILKNLPDLPVFHYGDFGIRYSNNDQDSQRICCWVENIVRINQILSKFKIAQQINLVRLFGNDNAFLYSVVCPILTFVFFPDYKVQYVFQTNHFSLLNGKKFSTSARHAIWVSEFVSEKNSDALRLYFTLNRAEKSSTNYTHSEFANFNEKKFNSEVISILKELIGKLNKSCSFYNFKISIEESKKIQEFYQLGLYCHNQLSNFHLKQYAQSLFLYLNQVTAILNMKENCFFLFSYALYFFLEVYSPLLPNTTKRILDLLNVKKNSTDQVPWHESLHPDGHRFCQFLTSMQSKQEDSAYENRTFY